MSTLRMWISAGIVALALTSSASARTIEVSVFNFDYSVNAVGGILDATVNVGDTVRWVWRGGFHDVKSVIGSAETFQSPLTSTIGATFEHTFTQLGTHTYYCTVHAVDLGDGTASGMVGTVTVLPATTKIVYVYNFDYSLNPRGQGPVADAVVNVGDRVRWIWQEGFHDVQSVASSSEVFDSGAPTSVVGTTFERQFNNPGVFLYYCTVHGLDQGTQVAGMGGTVTVQGIVDPCGTQREGDSNCDGAVNFDDISCFVAAIVGQTTWTGCAPGTSGCDYECVNDINDDGSVNFDDINGFVACLVGAC